MEAVLLIGLQASGKSTFCREQFFDTHVRLHPRILLTRERERVLLDACLAARLPFVVDDTNVTRAERGYYIELARSRGFRVAGYFFRSRLHDALERNHRRRPPLRVDDELIRATSARIELPKFAEGFDELHFVVSHHDDSFSIEDWRD
ncbi:MAG: AAA family ATPase [Planctomycetes bacterium]|nr:AAA family ATPase [Planctomycetota bacterium]